MRKPTAIHGLSTLSRAVLDAPEGLKVLGSSQGKDGQLSGHRISNRFERFTSPRCPPAHGGIKFDSLAQVEQHKTEIQRLLASEAEIKALAINYAAILKEKEGQLCKLQEENSSLRKSLEGSNGPSFDPKRDNSITSLDQIAAKMDNMDTTQARCYASENNQHTYSSFTEDKLKNGDVEATQSQEDERSSLDMSYLSEQEMDFEDSLEENKQTLTAICSDYELQIRQLRKQLDNEREISASNDKKFQEEHKLVEQFQKELHDLKIKNERTLSEMKETQKELEVKIYEVEKLQAGLEKRSTEKEQIEKGRLQTASLNEKIDLMQKIQQLEKNLTESYEERDTIQRELECLKQHLLDEELAKSEKINQRNKIIQELQMSSKNQKTRMLLLEKTLEEEIAKQGEIEKMKFEELEKSNEVIMGLNQKLVNYMDMAISKNAEVLNLQTVLRKCYAENESKEQLETDLAAAKEESLELSQSLKSAVQIMEMSKKEKNEVEAKLSEAQRMISEGEQAVRKLQEVNLKLLLELDNCTKKINSMSMSDYFVDRQIVINLLGAYIQRNHSKEVLDVMVRVLDFSEEDKKRIGLAEVNAEKSYKYGVLSFPGRFVRGILGTTFQEVHSASERQPLAELWMNFLLKESEETEEQVSETE